MIIDFSRMSVKPATPRMQALAHKMHNRIVDGLSDEDINLICKDFNKCSEYIQDHMGQYRIYWFDVNRRNHSWSKDNYDYMSGECGIDAYDMGAQSWGGS